MAHACNIRKKNEDKADDINTRTYINETQNLGDTYIHKYNIIIILNETKVSQCHSILSSVFG